MFFLFFFLFYSSVIAAASEGPRHFFCAPAPVAEKTLAAAKKVQQGLANTAIGAGNAVVLFARFADENAPAASPAWGRDLFDARRQGSISHFYDEMSRGRFRLRGTAAPRRYAVSGAAASYLATESDERGAYGLFVLEVLRQADADVDFSLYDNDGPDGVPNSGDDDGLVDAVFVVAQSTPRNFLVGGATGIAHLGLDDPFVTSDLGIDGRPIEIHPRGGTVQRGRNFVETAATICHEFAHLLGLPDLYDTAFLRSGSDDPHEDSAGIGNWGLMGWGTLGWHGDDGPVSFSAWSRVRLGWADVVAPVQLTQQVRIEPVGARGQVHQVPLPNGEYFLLEYRTRSASFYDRNIPGEGLLVWHVTGQGANQRVDLECADGLWRDGGYPLGERADIIDGGDNLDFWSRDADFNAVYGGNLGDASDLFDGLRFSSFTSASNPPATSEDRRWDVRVENIRRAADAMVADIAISPVVYIEEVELVDEDRSDILVAGELGELVFDLYKADGEEPLRVELSSSDSLVEIVAPVALYQVDPISRIDAEAGVRYQLQGAANALRVAPHFVGSHRAQLQVDVFAERADGRFLLWKDEVVADVVAARQRIKDVVLIDTLGNGDGRLQGGELLRVALSLEVESPSLLRAIDFRLSSLDSRVLPLDGGALSFRLPNRYDSRAVDAPEFLVAISAVDSVAFELAAENEFGAWRDTLWVRVDAGRDPSAPRIEALEAWWQARSLELRVMRDKIVEGNEVDAVRIVVFDCGSAQRLAEIELYERSGDFRGAWPGAWPGATYCIEAEAVDAEGNKGRGKRVRVELPVFDEVVVGRRQFKEVEDRIGAVAYDPQGRWLAVGDGARAYIYDITGGVVGGDPVRVLTFDARVEALAFDAVSSLAIAGRDGSLNIWDAQRGLLERSWSAHEGPVWAVSFSPTGELVSGGEDARLRRWDIGTGRELEVLQTSSAVLATALSGDGQYIAAGTRSAEVALWSGRERMRRSLRGHVLAVDALAFSPDGQWLASSAAGGRVWVWDLGRRGPGRALSESMASAGGLAFSPDGKWLASATGAAGIRLWDRLGFQAQHRLEAGSGIVAFAFAPQGGELLVAAWSGAEILQLPGFAEREFEQLTPVLFSPYPNPFNGEVALPFRLQREADVSLVIYDVLGQVVRVLEAGTLPAGYYYDPDRALSWDARDKGGKEVGTGVYIGELRVGKYALRRKFTLVR